MVRCANASAVVLGRLTIIGIDISTTLLLVSILVRETEIRPIQLFRGGITVPIGIDPRTASATRALFDLLLLS